MLGCWREYGNETVASWRNLLNKAKEAVPAIDDDDTILLMDDFKGGRGVLDVFENDVERFICAFHRGQNIVGNLGVQAAALPIDAINAQTPKELAALKKKYPKKTKKYMEQRAGEEQYRCMCPNMGSRCTTQGAESANKVNKPFRISVFGDIRTLSQLLSDRFHKRRKEVEAHKGKFPPKTTIAHAKQSQFAALVPAIAVQFTTKDQAIVNSQVDDNKSYIVDLAAVRRNDRKGMCDGLCNVRNIGVCRHIMAEARAQGMLVEHIMPSNQTTAGWKAAYDACAVLRPPSSAEIKKFEHLRDDNLCLPPVLKTRTGAPRKHKRIKSAVETLTEKLKKKHRKKK